jgi:hypothetical protein
VLLPSSGYMLHYWFTNSQISRNTFFGNKILSVFLHIFRHSVHLPCPASALAVMKSRIIVQNRLSLQCTCSVSRFIDYCGLLLPATPTGNRSSESFSSKCTENLTIGSGSVSVALQPVFWSISPLHSQVFTLPCWGHPFLFQVKICGIPPNITLPPISMSSSFQTPTFEGA